MNENIIKMERNELKYYINYIDYKVLHRILENHLTKDEAAIKNKGFIRSLYFDTIFDKAYYEKQMGSLDRKKYRLRIYNLDTQEVKLEIKSKYNQQITKETAIISRKDAIELQHGNYDVLLKYNNPVINKFYLDFKKEPHMPKVIIDYTRESFIFPYNDVRITLDKNIMATSNNLNLFSKDHIMKPMLKKGIMVLEIKYNKFLPSWIKKLIQVPRFERSAVSKYMIGRLDYFI